MPVKEEKSTNTSIAPWKVVPELSNMEKSYSYGDIYKGMAALMRPCMVFYNHFEESNMLFEFLKIR